MIRSILICTLSGYPLITKHFLNPIKECRNLANVIITLLTFSKKNTGKNINNIKFRDGLEINGIITFYPIYTIN